MVSALCSAISYVSAAFSMVSGGTESRRTPDCRPEVGLRAGLITCVLAPSRSRTDRGAEDLADAERIEGGEVGSEASPAGLNCRIRWVRNGPVMRLVR